MDTPLDATTLILIPCCAAKAGTGEIGLPTDPLASAVSPAVYAQLVDTRRVALAQLRSDAPLLTDQFAKNRYLQDGPDLGGHATTGRYLPALERYTGTLYSVPRLRSTLYQRLDAPGVPRVMILSALYGPLLPLSPIQDYNLRMDQMPARVWQRAFMPVLESYVRTQGIESIVLLVGSMTAYYRVASNAVSALLSRGAIARATHYHVHDGSTRTTPLEHGIALRDLLDGRLPTSMRLEARYLSGAGRVLRKPRVSTATELFAPSVAIAEQNVNGPSAGLRRAPPPHAGPAEVSRAVAVNAKSALPITLPVSVTMMASVQPPMQRDTQAPSMAPMRPTSAVPSQPTACGSVETHLSRFLELMRRLANGSDQGLPLAQLLENVRLPERGVYFFLDPLAPDGYTRWRICRVGTHAVSHGSKSTLRARLRAHLGTRNGSGNHRGSIFRVHVGNALLQRDGQAIATWGIGSVAPPALRESESLRMSEAEHERKVSHYIGQLPVLWLAVPDDASPTSERSTIERNAIALLSSISRTTLGYGSEWLGVHSPRSEIRSSGLWNLNYVRDTYDPDFLAVLERAVSRTLAWGYSTS